MIVYFDASALAKRYVAEHGSDQVLGWLDSSTPATSRLSEIEIASALARRCRQGAIRVPDRDRALATLTEDLRALQIVELSPEATEAARAVLLRHPLRAADAVQLASALLLRDRLRAPVAFLTYDEQLATAAEAEGLASPPPAG